ncbi:MAG: PDZ domain-containing protein [Armatimonadetes bacterium]|nr:PDZ domain-containing protein [Armatimonadota bacterium]
MTIDQLFVDAVREPMARYPNYDAKVPHFGGWAEDAFSPERAARWADPAGGYIHAMHVHEWGDYHYRITGKDARNKVSYEGGWQNNRQMGMHPRYRMVENIFEELDAPGEWFHNAKTNTLYYYPRAGLDPARATFEVVRLRSLIELRGTPAAPVRGVTLRGLTFRGCARTFMDNREPLLRSDWTTYRGGALFFTGAEDCEVADCFLDQLGGNAIFASAYNRRLTVRGCRIENAGANGVAFVGDPGAVRNPLFEYGQRQSLAQIDRTPGPKTDSYPADCLVEECLITRTGRVEKQTAPVQIAMAQAITVRHCSIYDVPRAGLNIGDGCWGGHVIEWCDIFDTVLETGDHGSFNSWGRDRYWGLTNAPADLLPELARLDAVRPVYLRNNRWRCDHGWDVDLDDGSSNFEITGNLFLNGGLKLREGFWRVVRGNITVNNTLHPHVWYDNCQDVVSGNIFMGAYRPAGGMPRGQWGQKVDGNLFTAEADRLRFAGNGCDAHSVAGDPLFVDPAKGDYRVKEGSPALKLGFVNFAMDQFGVTRPELRALARTPELPGTARPAAAGTRAALAAYWLGAPVRELAGEEYSAFGVGRDDGGVVVGELPADSAAERAGLRRGDLVRGVNGAVVKTLADLTRLRDAAAGAPLKLTLVRGQQPAQATVVDYPHVVAESAEADGFRTIAPPAASGIAAITARPGTHNEPVAVLIDGKLAANYGPVFGNDTADGVYRADLGQTRAVGAVCTWSYNQNENRGSQRFMLYGSVAPEPGFDVANAKLWTPIALVDSPCASRFLATRLQAPGGLGEYRWLAWAVAPVSAIGENTAYVELAVAAR